MRNFYWKVSSAERAKETEKYLATLFGSAPVASGQHLVASENEQFWYNELCKYLYPVHREWPCRVTEEELA